MTRCAALGLLLSAAASAQPQPINLAAAGALFRKNCAACHARTGKVLWKFNTGAGGSGVSAPAITYLQNGRQHVAVIAGASLFDFAVN